jgi:hypothetical protein
MLASIFPSMMSSSVLLPTVVSIVLAVVIAVIRYGRLKSEYKLPPFVEGGLPIVGNLLQMPPSAEATGALAKEWASKYGEM